MALAAVPGADHRGTHDVGRRTAQHHFGLLPATAEISDLGDVGLQLRQAEMPESIITGEFEDAVYGSFMLLTVTPARFAKDTTALQAAKDAVVKATQLSVKAAKVSLNVLPEFPQAVRVDFQVTFYSRKDRQTFTWDVAANGAKHILQNINDLVPEPYKGRCQPPGEDQLMDGNIYLSLNSGAVSDKAEMARLSGEPLQYGEVLLERTSAVTGVQWPDEFAKSQKWQEGIAMAIADAAWVSRLQVGILMAVEPRNNVSVNFWLTLGDATLRQAAIQRVESTSPASLLYTASWYIARWFMATSDLTEFPAHGRITLQVPNAQLLVTNESASKDVERAIRQVAMTLGRQGSQLSVKDVNVSLAAAGSGTSAVQLSFRVVFGSPQDRQVFTGHVSMDAGEGLVNRINEQVPAPFKGNCRLPGQQAAKVSVATLRTELGKPYVVNRFSAVRAELYARDPQVQEAISRVIATLASVPREQVGIIVVPEWATRLMVYYWVASANATFRQAAAQRVMSYGSVYPHMLRELHKMGAAAKSGGPQGVGYGSVALEVPDAPLFANSTAVREALRGAISQVATIPGLQVQTVDVRSGAWNGTAVQVGFQVAFPKSIDRQNFTRSMTLDGGETLVKSINEKLPEPFKGKCRLPGPQQAQVNVTTVRRELFRPYGTILVYVMFPHNFANGTLVREALAKRIAELASVSPAQVGTMMAVESASLVSIDFWVALTNTTLQQAAIQQVESRWNNSALRWTVDLEGLVVTACGGTIACCPAEGARNTCHS